MAVRHQAKVLAVTKVTLANLQRSRVQSRCKFAVTLIGFFLIETFYECPVSYPHDCMTKMLVNEI
jgi:hypothetical protein